MKPNSKAHTQEFKEGVVRYVIYNVFFCIMLTDIQIKNDVYTISYIDGTVSLTIKDGKTIPDFISLVDSGNDGDTYDYSPLPGGLEIVLDFQSAKVFNDTKKNYLLLCGDCIMVLPLLSLINTRIKVSNAKMNIPKLIRSLKVTSTPM